MSEFSDVLRAINRTLFDFNRYTTRQGNSRMLVSFADSYNGLRLMAEQRFPDLHQKLISAIEIERSSSGDHYTRLNFLQILDRVQDLRSQVIEQLQATVTT
jgi:hypothetical protein